MSFMIKVKSGVNIQFLFLHSGSKPMTIDKDFVLDPENSIKDILDLYLDEVADNYSLEQWNNGALNHDINPLCWLYAANCSFAFQQFANIASSSLDPDTYPSAEKENNTFLRYLRLNYMELIVLNRGKNSHNLMLRFMRYILCRFVTILSNSYAQALEDLFTRKNIDCSKWSIEQVLDYQTMIQKQYGFGKTNKSAFKLLQSSNGLLKPLLGHEHFCKLTPVLITTDLIFTLNQFQYSRNRHQYVPNAIGYGEDIPQEYFELLDSVDPMGKVAPIGDVFSEFMSHTNAIDIGADFCILRDPSSEHYITREFLYCMLTDPVDAYFWALGGFLEDLLPLLNMNKFIKSFHIKCHNQFDSQAFVWANDQANQIAVINLHIIPILQKEDESIPKCLIALRSQEKRLTFFSELIPPAAEFLKLFTDQSWEYLRDNLIPIQAENESQTHNELTIVQPIELDEFVFNESDIDYRCFEFARVRRTLLTIKKLMNQATTMAASPTRRLACLKSILISSKGHGIEKDFLNLDFKLFKGRCGKIQEGDLEFDLHCKFRLFLRQEDNDVRIIFLGNPAYH
jgi:hypothetical protein